jgi:hypothetical protein
MGLFMNTNTFMPYETIPDRAELKGYSGHYYDHVAFVQTDDGDSLIATTGSEVTYLPQAAIPFRSDMGKEVSIDTNMPISGIVVGSGPDDVWIFGDDYCLGCAGEGYVATIDIDGAQIGTRVGLGANTYVADIVIGAQRVFALDSSGKVHVIDKATMREVDVLPVAASSNELSEVRGSLAILGNDLLVASPVADSLSTLKGIVEGGPAVQVDAFAADRAAITQYYADERAAMAAGPEAYDQFLRERSAPLIAGWPPGVLCGSGDIGSVNVIPWFLRPDPTWPVPDGFEGVGALPTGNTYVVGIVIGFDTYAFIHATVDSSGVARGYNLCEAA